MKNLWFQAHWLVGITAGIILVVVGVTGGLLSFEDEIQNWLNRDVRQVAVSAAAPLSPTELLARVKAQQPEARIASLQFSGDPADAVRVNLGQQKTRYADPYTGRLIEGEGARGREFFRGTRSLHRYLVSGGFGNRDIGKQLVGVSTLLCAGLALSGLYLRWPRRSQRLSARAWLTFDPALKGRPFLWHLHAIVGTWVLVAFLMMSLTGPYWSYEWYRSGMYKLAGVEAPQRRGEGPRNASARNADGRTATPRDGEPRNQREGGAVPANIDAVWHSFQGMAPDGFRTATLNLPQENPGTIEIRYVDRDAWHSRANNSLTLDAASGAVRRHERYEDKSFGGRFMSSVLSWHSGSVFGVVGKTLFMLASLSMPLFAISGWMMYLQRRARKKLLRKKG